MLSKIVILSSLVPQIDLDPDRESSPEESYAGHIDTECAVRHHSIDSMDELAPAPWRCRSQGTLVKLRLSGDSFFLSVCLPAMVWLAPSPSNPAITMQNRLIE